MNKPELLWCFLYLGFSFTHRVIFHAHTSGVALCLESKANDSDDFENHYALFISRSICHGREENL